MDEYEPNLGDFNPSWMEDGGGISGEQGEPELDDYTQWDTLALSQGADDTQDLSSSGTGGGITVTTENGSGWSGLVSEVDGVTTLTFDSRIYKIYDLGGGQVGIGCV